MQKSVLVCICVLLAGCQKYVFEEQVGAVYEASRKEVTISVPASSDILFVIDNSGSMALKIDNVRKNVVAFVKALKDKGNDFRLSVTTTDNRDQYPTGCADKTGVGMNADPVHDGVCGRLLAPKGKVPYLASSQFNTAEEMANAFAEYLRRDNDTVNTGGSAVEQPMKSAASAVSAELIAEGKPNAGVFRKDALLLVIIVTDESDCSFDSMSMSQPAQFSFSPTNLPAGFSCYAKAADLRSPAAWADDIIKAKQAIDGSPVPQKENVRAGLISGSVRNADGTLLPRSCRISNAGASDQCACFYGQSQQFCAFTALKTPDRTQTGSDGPHCGFQATTEPNSPLAKNNDESNCCTSMANDRLFAFANTFDNLKDTICQPDYSDSLLQLADLANRQCFTLDKAPLDDDPANVLLRMRREGKKGFDDIPLTDPAAPTDGWYYLHGDGAPRACLSGIWERQGKDTISLFVVSGADVGSTPIIEP